MELPPKSFPDASPASKPHITSIVADIGVRVEAPAASLDSSGETHQAQSLHSEPMTGQAITPVNAEGEAKPPINVELQKLEPSPPPIAAGPSKSNSETQETSILQSRKAEKNVSQRGANIEIEKPLEIPSTNASPQEPLSSSLSSINAEGVSLPVHASEQLSHPTLPISTQLNPKNEEPTQVSLLTANPQPTKADAKPPSLLQASLIATLP